MRALGIRFLLPTVPGSELGYLLFSRKHLQRIKCTEVQWRSGNGKVGKWVRVNKKTQSAQNPTKEPLVTS